MILTSWGYLLKMTLEASLKGISNDGDRIVLPEELLNYLPLQRDLWER